MITGFAQWFEWLLGYKLLDVIDRIETHPNELERREAWDALDRLHEKYLKARGSEGHHGIYGVWRSAAEREDRLYQAHKDLRN